MNAHAPDRERPRRRSAGLVLLMLLSVSLGAGASAPSEADPPARWVVGFQEVPAGLQAGSEYEGAVVLRVDRALGFAAVEVSDPMDFRERASANREVRYVEPDAEVRAAFQPNDPLYDRYQWGPQQIGAPAAWDRTLGSTAVNVCVGDTGVRATHEDLAGGRFGGGYDFVNDDADPSDDEGHGTFTTGIAVATTDNGQGIAGIAQATFTHVKVLDETGSGTSSDVASGIRWCADAGAHVVSLSLGSNYGSTVLRDAVRHAWNKGALVVAASGNDGCSNCVNYPAKYSEVIAVGCTTSSKAVCSFSNGGMELELVAPGKDIASTYHTGDDRYAMGSGTSASVPHVAGAAALVKAVHPHLTNQQLRDRLQQTAEDVGPAGWDRASGYGIVRPDLAFTNGEPTVTGVACAPSDPVTSRMVSCELVAEDDSASLWFEVDWGDGNLTRAPATGAVAPGETVTASHAWQTAGEFVIAVTATDNENRTSSAYNVTLTVHPNTAPDLRTFTCDRQATDVSLPVTCTLHAVDDSDGIAYRVDWGDGNVTRVPETGFLTPGTSAEVRHTWPAEGNYTLAARAVDDADPPLESGPLTYEVRAATCVQVREGAVQGPGRPAAGDGFSSLWNWLPGHAERWEVSLPEECGRVPFRLDATDGAVSDFDVCWYREGRKLACHGSLGPEAGRVPDGADAAHVLLRAGALAAYRLAVGAEAVPAHVTWTFRHDDGTMETAVTVNAGDDMAMKTFTLPITFAAQAPRMERATLWVHGLAEQCSTSGVSHVLRLNLVPLTRFDACETWPVGAWGWAGFDVPVEALAATRSPEFTIEKHMPLEWRPWAHRNARLGIDQETDHGRSFVTENGHRVPGELLWVLTVEFAPNP